ncbi:MAG TPA: hypothetical protein DDW52_00195 [Planctomycetaceae bacterium]|nr:hypothetical protein [Planctomycetaceae bacterium]
MLFKRPQNTPASAKLRRRAQFARRLRTETLEERRLLTATPLQAEVAYGPEEAIEWRVEPLAQAHTEIHHGPDGSHEFTWAALPADDNANDPAAGLDSSQVEGSNPLFVGPTQTRSFPSGGANFDAASSLSSIPQLSSLPQATAKLFLDFDGHYEANWGIYSNLVTPVYDIDGDQASFSSEELSNIAEIWERVAEDFAPFNIDVTTIEPAVLGDSVPDSAANAVALRIAIGGSWEDWRGSVSGGVAYINSYTSSVPNTAYVFSVNRAAGDPRSVAEAATHEAGHAYGLQHQSLYDADGTKLEEYHPGEPNDWAPLMGAGASNTIQTSIWHNGTDTFGPNSYQDDLAMLTRSINQITYRTDDHGGSLGSATPLDFDGQYWTSEGIIETNTDVDVFTFSTAGGKHSFDIISETIAPNLDVVVELRDSSGALVASADPTDSRSASLIANLSAGDYSLRVTKTNVYGYIGSYSIRGFTASPGPFITSVSTTGILQTGFDTIDVEFESAIDPATFNVDDVQLLGPTGEIVPTSIVAVPGSNNTRFEIVLAETTVEGLYDLSIGPNIADPAGNLMNQNVDEASGTAGDVLEERFSVRASGWSVALESSFTLAHDKIYVGPNGNIYLTGEFAGTADLDPGPGVVERSSYPSDTGLSNLDGFIAVYTPNGEFLQVHTFSGASTEFINGLVFDASGNAYVAGSTSSTNAQFGSFTVASQGSRDAYLFKLSPAGNVDWVRSWGSSESDSISDLQFTPSGNLQASGMFRGTVDFDPGAGTAALTSGGAEDAFIAEFTTDGTFVSVNTFTGSNFVKIEETGFDSSGNMYVAGRFRDTAQFQYGNSAITSLTSAGQYDTFLLKVDNSGNLAWIKQLSGIDYVSFPAMAVSGDGKVTLGGRFKESVQLDSTTTLASADSYDGFVSQWDSAGNLLSSGALAGSGNEYIRDINIDASGDVLISGSFYETTNMDPGAGTVSRTARDGDGFLLRLDDAGNFKHVHQMEADLGWIDGTASDADGNLFVAGRFYTGSAQMPTGERFETEANLTSFIMKLAYAPGITVTPLDGIQTSESGGSDQINVVLDVAPTDDVTISLASSDSSEASVSPSSLTFTPANWNIPQVVSVTGVDDSSIDGDATYVVVTSPAASADPRYNGLDAVDLPGINLDDDAPIELFYDSFEVSEWNGKWVEDSQNDWRRRSMRSSAGDYSAEIDGWASNATLTVSNPIDMTPYGSAEFSFDWYIESSWDSNEYIKLEFWNGSSWNEIDSLDGNVDQENTWHSHTIELDSQYLVSDFRFRYRAKVSSSREDGHVDNVRLMATSFAAPPNTAPVALSDGYSGVEDTPLNIAAAGVLANDTDEDGDALTAVLVSGASSGAVVLNSDGSFSYTPDANFNGSDSFTYRASDGSQQSNLATVQISVAAVNDAPVADNLSTSVKENNSKAITLSGSDVDGDSLTYSVVSGPSNGSLTGSVPNLIYTPADGFTGTDSFTYIASDGTLNSAEATVTITVADNNAPVAGGQSVSLNEDGSLAISLTGSDADEDPITFEVVDLPPNGLLTGSAPNVTYTPDANFNGSDSFTFRVNDGTDDSALATVAITVTPVNDAPVASSGSASTNEDTSVDIPLSGTDVDGDSLAYSVAIAPENGSVVINGSVATYTPDANFNGADSFSFVANDGTENSAPAVISISVAPVNDLPVAVGDAWSLDQDSPLSVDAPGVLANDSDVDGDAITASLVDSPSSGSVILNADGSFTYTPDPGFAGSDSFTYRADDGTGLGNTVSVELTVNAIAAGPALSQGVVSGVTSNWQTVTLPKSYASMVVVATPNYNTTDAPAVVRIRNADSGNSFEIRVDAAGPNAVGSVDVHYMVVEEGVYSVEGPGGYKLEAVKYNSTVTDENNSWVGETRDYLQTYEAPVVVGQVMTYNDSQWSTFWAAGNTRQNPSNSVLRVGKHVGEDPSPSRANETVGYIVFESTTDGSAQIDGQSFVAALGADSIKGMGDSVSNATHQYAATGLPNASTAILSQAAMDGANGGWAVLRGANPLAGDAINLGIEEDQDRDTERKHTPEQVAYVLFADNASGASDALATSAPSPETQFLAVDVNQDGFVSPLDALLIINRLNSQDQSTDTEELLGRIDTSGDGVLSPLDALLVINQLNRDAVEENLDDAPVQAPEQIAPAVDSFFGDFDEEEFWG